MKFKSTKDIFIFISLSILTFLSTILTYIFCLFSDDTMLIDIINKANISFIISLIMFLSLIYSFSSSYPIEKIRKYVVFILAFFICHIMTYVIWKNEIYVIGIKVRFLLLEKRNMRIIEKITHGKIEINEFNWINVGGATYTETTDFNTYILILIGITKTKREYLVYCKNGEEIFKNKYFRDKKIVLKIKIKNKWFLIIEDWKIPEPCS